MDIWDILKQIESINETNVNYKKTLVLLLRLALGWILIYAGWQKFTTPGGFNAAFYLKDAATFSGFYHWLMSPGILPIVNVLNVWGQLILGVCLVAGFQVRWAAKLAALMMLLYYFPILKFPHFTSDPHSFIVDDHIIYSLGYLALDALHAGRIFGLDSKILPKRV